jgi:formate/nitrite transporter
MACKTPAEIAQAAITEGKAKTLIPPDKLILLGFLAGAYIAFGGFLAVAVGGATNAELLGKGVQKLLFASVFPVGFLLAIIGGSEFFTGNCLLPPIAKFSGKTNWNGVFTNWIWVYLGNFIGSVFVAYFLATATGLFSATPWQSFIISVAEEKVSLGWWQLFWRAVGCNWLVCLAVWLSLAAEDVIGKIFAIWFPIMAFAAIGFEHSVTNMFLVPAGMFAGASVSLPRFIFMNLLPVTIGNVAGGLILVAWVYEYIYLTDEKK